MVEAVTAHQPADQREARSRDRILRALRTLPSPLDRHAGPVHLTASGVVVGRRGTVLHRHRRLRRWLQPGGHLEAGESPPQAALRESREETGLDVRHPAGVPNLVHVDVHPAAQGHVHLDLRYLLEAPDDEPRPLPDESPDVAWFGWDQAEARADEALIGALRRARRTAAGG